MYLLREGDGCESIGAASPIDSAAIRRRRGTRSATGRSSRSESSLLDSHRLHSRLKWIHISSSSGGSRSGGGVGVGASGGTSCRVDGSCERTRRGERRRGSYECMRCVRLPGSLLGRQAASQIASHPRCTSHYNLLVPNPPPRTSSSSPKRFDISVIERSWWRRLRLTNDDFFLFLHSCTPATLRV